MKLESIDGRYVAQSDETVSSQEPNYFGRVVVLARILFWQPRWEISTPQKVNLKGWRK